MWLRDHSLSMRSLLGLLQQTPLQLLSSAAHSSADSDRPVHNVLSYHGLHGLTFVGHLPPFPAYSMVLATYRVDRHGRTTTALLCLMVDNKTSWCPHPVRPLLCCHRSFVRLSCVMIQYAMLPPVALWVLMAAIRLCRSTVSVQFSYP